MKILKTLFFIIFCLKIEATTDFETILEKSKNQSAIKSYTTKADLNKLNQKIKTQKNLGIRIYGDSHMAADFFPNVLRNAFFKPNSIGFVYPLQPKYQQNLNFKCDFKDFEVLNSRVSGTEENYPLGGVIARALKQGAKISLELSFENQKFNTGFLFRAPSNSKAFEIKDAKGKSYNLRSTKEGKWSYKELELTFPLELTALQKNAELGGYFITNKKGGNLFLDTVAINGAKSDLWLRWNPKVLTQELKVLKNDLIIIAYGSNDALFGTFDKQIFKDNLKKWIRILKEQNKDSVFILVSPPTVVQKKGKEYQISPNFSTIRKSLNELAKEEKMLFFDMHQFIEDSGGKKAWIRRKLSLKDVHLSISGYELMAKKMVQDLKRVLNQASVLHNPRS